jgi:predicted O-methyltransferase YrrM
MTVEEVLGRASRGVERYGWQAFAKEAAARPARPALAPIAARRLSAAAAQARGVDELLDVAMGFDAFGIRITPGQVRCEIRGLLEVLRATRPRRLLEIGTANGGSLFLFAQTAMPDAHIISVDLHHGEFGGGYPAWKIPLYKAFTRGTQRLDLVRGDSHAPQTAEDVRRRLDGEQLDFLFIDGDHTYDGVKQDFETFAPLVRPGGLIGFHDIAPPTSPERQSDDIEYLVGDVPRYWNEISDGSESREFVDPAGGGCFGIGLLRV